MKKILYLYLLLISAPIFSMQQPTNKNQIPMNDKKLSINAKEIGVMVLAAAPVLVAATMPILIIPQIPTIGALLYGGAKIGIGITAAAYLYNQENKNK